MNKSELLIEFYQNKDFEKLKEVLTSSKDKYEQEVLARIYLEEQDYTKASRIYAKLGCLYEFGRCELLLGHLENTTDIWKNIKIDNPATLWGKSLLEFINLYVTNLPTFFQIRSFLEVDFDALLRAGLITYCENIANGAHLFAQNNQESYKFIGRVFVNNNYYELAEIFLNRGKEVCYLDPEVHFLLAKCRLNKNDKAGAIKSLETSIERGYGYFPARKLLAEIKQTN